MDQEGFATAQARWLATLAEALGEADRLSRMLARVPERTGVASVLARLVALRTEVEALQRRADKAGPTPGPEQDRTP